MIRRDLYLKVCEALRTVEEVKHIDLWNRNVEFIEQETAWARPAVFVEICPITWDTRLGRTAKRGTGKMRLHIVTDWVGSAADGSDDQQEALQSWSLTDKIEQAVMDMAQTGDYILDLTETYTNHDHEEIVESIDVYNVRYRKIME